VKFNLASTLNPHLHLVSSSCHPPHTFKGVPKGLATRVRCSCSSITDFEEQSKILKSRLCKRGYRVVPVQAAIYRQKTLLSYKHKEEGSRVPLVTTYHHALKNINTCTILKSHLTILYNNERMARDFIDPPMAAFRLPRNLKNIIVRSRLTTHYQSGVSPRALIRDASYANSADLRTLSAVQ
jgi:hypothetical protein